MYNTARWLYQADEYVAPLAARARLASAVISPSLRRWDRRHGQSADRVIAISRRVRARIEAHWGVDAEIIYPPHGARPDAPQEEIPGIEPGFFLAVSRLLAYKRVDVLLRAMELLPHHRLVVVGAGPEEAALRLSAPSNCMFLRDVSDGRLRWLYANCTALLSAANEDLGLTPLEATAFGKPVAVLRSGGFLETVVEGQTGVFFDEPDAVSVVAALRMLLSNRWHVAELEHHAAKFSSERFVRQLRAAAASLFMQ